MTFRAKLGSLALAATLAFLIVIVTGAISASRVDQELGRIQQLYLPKVELGPKLERQLEAISRAFQDAVAARDRDALAVSARLKDSFLADLEAARGVVEPGEANALRNAMEAYYAEAHALSQRLIAGETGEGVVEAMASMQAKRGEVTQHLVAVIRFDRGELGAAFANAARAQQSAARIRLWVGALCLFFLLGFSVWIAQGLLGSLARLGAGFQRFATGDFTRRIEPSGRDEVAQLARQANAMAESLGRLSAERDSQDWLKAGSAALADALRGELEPTEVGQRATAVLASYLKAPAAALFAFDSEESLELIGQYSLGPLVPRDGARLRFRTGEGLVGQTALQKELRVVVDPPPDYMRIRSGLGDAAPKAIVLSPIVREGRVTAVLELALFTPVTEPIRELLSAVRETLGVALEVARSRAQMQALLAKTQELARHLAAQEDELRSANDELRERQNELQQSNEELAQQAEELEAQRRTLQSRNGELDQTRKSLEQKAAELSTVSAYKSQFLTNMSHELRTPLNSMLLLSNLLADNEGRHLVEKEVEYAKTIHSAGKDLLALINQVLDLAKVESGKQDIALAEVSLKDVADRARRVFEPLARDKGVAFSVELAPDLPASIFSDGQRVEQVLTNLLGNAFKFTQVGSVRLRIRRPEPSVDFQLAFEVSDTGPGIAPEDQERIFAPFEQVGTAHDRRYGGTGLGLTISRELASLLGGELRLSSVPGKGSTFSLYLPERLAIDALGEMRRPGHPPPRESPTDGSGDDLASLQAGDAFLLVIEDDALFARTMGDVIHSQGLKYVWASRGLSALEQASALKPRGVLLDVKLPDIDGFEVMKRLKADLQTADIPVHFITAVDAASRGIALGATGYLTKPVSRADLIGVIESLVPKAAERAVRILVVEDDAPFAESLLNKLKDEHLDARGVASGRGALEALKKERFHCMVVDLALPDMHGLHLLHAVQEQCGTDAPSVVICTGRALSKGEVKDLEAYAEAIVLKGDASSERLLNEIRLFVRRLREGAVAGPPRVAPAPQTSVRLEGKAILIVDDDMRTVYALSATLRAKGAEVLVADNGAVALETLAGRPNVDAVLMDIMMPEMDGYEAMRRMRAQERFKGLPIVALTAKAMKGDEQKCREAGASDYLPKPIDAGKLLEKLALLLSAGA